MLALNVQPDPDWPDTPFTAQDAYRHGVRPFDLRCAVLDHRLRRMLRGVYVAAHAPDCLDLRLAALRLVVPPDAVVTDETAGWLHGAPMVLGPNADVVVPDVHVFHRCAGNRLRNQTVVSGERGLSFRDVRTIDGIRVTTPLRTACDLGRLRSRFRAMAALDQLLALGVFTREQLVAEVARFRGYRGVVQLRALSTLADARSQSPPESALRLCWIEAGLPTPEPQCPVEGTPWQLDLGLESLRFAVEYDGAAFHSNRTDQTHDAGRRRCVREEHGWHLAVVRRDGLYGPHANPHAFLSAEYDAAMRSVGVRRRLWTV